jgi:murein DD-endopeptidase MepM/ murein hydrolase activator NlpD
MKNRKKLVSILAGIMAALLLLSLLLSLIPVARAASSSEIRNQINDLKTQQGQIRDQMNDIKEQYEKNEDEIADLVARKAVIDQEIFLLHAEIDNINQQISAYALLIADKQDELDEALARYNALSAEYRERIRVMEEEGSMSYWEVLFKASSFSDLLDRLNMIQEIAASDRRRLEALNEAAQQVEQARNELQQEKQALEETRATLDATYADLSAKQAEAQALLTELMEKAEELEGLYEGFEMEEAELMAQIAKKEQEYNDAKYQEWLAHIATATTATTAPPETTKPTDAGENPGPGEDEDKETEPEETTKPTEPAPVSWIRPCSYVLLTSPFGYRDAPTSGASSYHQGVDLAGPEGTPIYASRSGTVTIATYSKSAGYYVTINHGDGFSSIYMHMTNYVVSPGTKVAQGQLIGYMGSTGISTGPHLHFGIAYNGTYVNPALYVPLY